ncbi:MAG: DUF1801 domain-containing protein [bacterium]
MTSKPDPRAFSRIESYPSDVRERLLSLRTLILDVAAETDGVEGFHDTVKWGEPSYASSSGSTIRIDWKEDTPDRYYMFFHCRSRLVETFKVLYDGVFEFEDNRAIVFRREAEIPEGPLRHCISMALLYHKVKHLRLLGA